MGFLKGQGATEYLVLLAVVLIIALVSIALLGFFPSVSTDTKIVQSQTYWRGTARPFAIQDINIAAATGATSIVIQNYEAQGALTITANGLTLTCGTNTITGPAALTAFQPGEIKTLTLAASGVYTAQTVSAPYDCTVSFTYTNPYGFTGKQTGTKGIGGKYT